MASPPLFNRDHTNARTKAISGALELAKRIVVAQLQDIDPIVLDGIKDSFARLEEESLEACQAAPSPPASLPPAPASDQPKRLLDQTAESGSKGIARPVEKGSHTQNQEGEKSLPFRGDVSEVKKGGKRSGPFYDSSSDEEAAGKKRKIETRVPTKYAAVNEANYPRDDLGFRILEDFFSRNHITRRPWMTTEEEQAFFDKHSFERCFKCSELGHSMDDCVQRKARRRRCNRPHLTRDCRSKELHCGVCGGQHVRGMPGCRAREIEVLKEKLLTEYYSVDLP